MPERRVLIIGWGNPLREDDGAGFVCAQRLGGLAVHQLTPELAADIAQADTVVFLDADSTLPAGRWAVEDIVPDEPAEPLTHHFPPSTLLALANCLYGRSPSAVLVRIGGERFGHGDRLSAEVASAVDAVVAYVGIEYASAAS